MKVTLLSLLFTLGVGSASAFYDACPKFMKLVGKDCQFVAGNISAPGFNCKDSLSGRFGNMTCKGTHFCEEWAVGACEEWQEACRKSDSLLKGMPAKVIKTNAEKKILKKHHAIVAFCRNATFTILDPGEDPTPKEEPVFKPDEEPKLTAADQGWDFHAALILQDQLSKGFAALDENGYPNLCENPDFQRALPDSYLQCLSNQESESESWKTVRSSPNPFGSSNTAYRIRKKNGEFELAMNVQFTFVGDQNDRAEVVTKILGAKRCVESFFKLHKIKLNLGLSANDGWLSAKSWSDWWDADVANITVRKEIDNINSVNWAIRMTNNNPPELSPEQLCGTMVHELGHRMGLPDRYYPQDKANYLPDGAAMMQSGNWSLREAYFAADDLRRLTDPVCDYGRDGLKPVPAPLPTP